MLEQYVASDLAQRRMKDSMERPSTTARQPKQDRRRRTAVRSSSAAVLRGLADRLEPSPTA